MPAPVGPIRPSSPFPFETDPLVIKDPTFGDVLKQAVDRVNDLQIHADDQMFKLAMGEVEDIHEVMTALNKAALSLQLTIEIRDKVIEAYQTLLRAAM